MQWSNDMMRLPIKCSENPLLVQLEQSQFSSESPITNHRISIRLATSPSWKKIPRLAGDLYTKISQ